MTVLKVSSSEKSTDKYVNSESVSVYSEIGKEKKNVQKHTAENLTVTTTDCGFVQDVARLEWALV